MKKTAEKVSRAEKVAQLKAELAEFEDGLDEDEMALLFAQIQGYSDRNCLLIAMQCPQATEVRGFKAWLAVGRCVRKGETGIQILAPAGKEEKTKAEKAAGEKERMFFRLAYVFDISQTDKIEK